MWIECLVKREEPVVVPIGNEKYTFEEDEHGRRIAEVWLEDHIECFLAVPHLYREAKPIEKPKPMAPVTRRPAVTRIGVDDMKRPALMAELKDLGVTFRPTAKNDELRDLLNAARLA